MNSCQSEVLAENPRGYISWCCRCQEFTFGWENLVLNFTMEHLVDFRDWLTSNKENPDVRYLLPHGKNLIFQSPVQNLRIAFTAAEIDELVGMLTRAQLIIHSRIMVN